MSDDLPLLRAFVTERSDTAFRQLVEQRIDFVYAAALRQVGGDAHLAREVAQNVFLALARKAPALTARPHLTGWLFTSTRFAAMKALRARTRRLKNETKAHVMHEVLEAPSSAGGPIDWHELRPVIDAALHELGAKDREAILLRFFEGRSLAEIGAAVGLAENAARMRVDRALEKLRGRLSVRGITSTAAALGAALAAQPTITAPAGLAAATAGPALAGAALAASGGTAAVSLLHFMSTTKLAAGAASLVAALGIGALLGSAYQSRAATETPTPSAAIAAARTGLATLRAENRRLSEALARSRPAHDSADGPSTRPGIGAGDSPGDNPTLRVLLDLRRRKLAKLEFEFIGEDTQLQDAFAEVFGLSTTERTNLQHAIDAAGERLAALTRENTNVSRAPNGDVQIAIKPFPEAGGAAYDALLQRFADTLGPERYQAFLAFGAEQIEKRLGRFGTPERAITLSREVDGNGGVGYRINDHTHHGPLDNSNYVSDRLTPERFAREVGPLLELLPADFIPRR
jgi:RNA polymerase sigma factor (sigma-70 family)